MKICLHTPFQVQSIANIYISETFPTMHFNYIKLCIPYRLSVYM